VVCRITQKHPGRAVLPLGRGAVLGSLSERQPPALLVE